MCQSTVTSTTYEKDIVNDMLGNFKIATNKIVDHNRSGIVLGRPETLDIETLQLPLSSLDLNGAYIGYV